jgi:hypothetical protein
MKRKAPSYPMNPQHLLPFRVLMLFVLIALSLIFLSLTSATPARLSYGTGANSKAHTPQASKSLAKSSDGVWSVMDQASVDGAQPTRPDISSYRAVNLSRPTLAKILQSAPPEFSALAATRSTTLSLPNPDGTFSRFSIAESPIMAPELSAQFPEIKTYVGQGIDDPTATTRFDWTRFGFHAIILSGSGTKLIEPAAAGDLENYIVYLQQDVIGGSGECDVTERDQQEGAARNPIAKHSPVSPAVMSGTTLRTYRLAAAATAEYTQAYGGGTVGGGLSAITTTINLVDAIYEREVAVRLTLIAGETSIIFTDTTTDGYTTDNVGSLIGENQTKLTSVIGAANYDVGHVFDGRLLTGGAFSWQGLATLSGVCQDGVKARGVDIFRSVFPTSVFAYYSAAHELGHQFGASHTFNATSGTCGAQRSAGTAYEPVNGSTIMGYRLACAPEDLMSTDTYFHNASIEQIVNYTAAGGNSCAVPSGTGNNPPVVDAGPTFTIPMGTPFILTATGGDQDGDALTFGWEEFDLGTAAPPSTDDGSRPIFRSFLPTSSPARMFPRLQDVLSGAATLGESMPATTRTMNFRVTVRDNRSGGGGIGSAATQVNVRADAGPFTVTQPAASVSWPTGSNQTVTWNVAATDTGSVNCANVRITLSTDGGTTFPIVLANSTSNDGSELVIIPGTPSGNARVKVEGAGNIFFNISRSFTITGSSNTVPTISGFTPGSGPPGTGVTINGTNFISPSAVQFNGQGANFTLNSTTQIVATVPNAATTGPITVTTGSGTATSSSNFTVTTPANTVQLSAATYSVSEATADAVVTVNRVGDTTAAATIDYSTSDTAGANNCNVVNGAASSRCDYLATLGTLHFAANETSKTISIPIVDDSWTEGPETFAITLANPSGAILGSPAVATVTITDNDNTNSPNPIDSSAFFVRAHYIDFLNREPDTSGLNFWTGEIDNCTPKPQCIDLKRINVSAAFYLSIEFQGTGYLVERMYKAAYGDASASSSFNGTHQLSVPVVRLNEFLSDTQEIGLGVVVGSSGWEQALENNKQAFAAEFVQRTRFTTALLPTMTAAQFVDRLNTNAGNPLSQAERDQLVNDLSTSAKTRAQVLRAVAEDLDLNSAEFNRAFVLMQFFGYLRRNPNDPQDMDYTGYDFWLTKLNQFGGNFVNAEMVKAFITSAEYRQRFGP